MIFTDFLNNRVMKIFRILLPVIAGAILTACTDTSQLMPTISGKAGEVVIVINKAQWESEPGIVLRNLLGQDEPFLPQQEPMFTLINIPEAAFTKIFKTHRNIIVVNIKPGITEPKIIYKLNVWASPQIVVSISAPDSQTAAQEITKQQNKLLNSLEQAERNRNIQNAMKYEEKSLRKTVTDMFGGSPFFPKGYSQKKKTDRFIWISYETTYTNQGIFIYSFPFRDSSDFSLENLIAMRNKILEENVPGPRDNTYMTTSTISVLPALRWVTYKGQTFAEVKGLWEVKNDFMGGPFADHAFLDKEKKNVIVLEAFVYAPRYSKRNYMRQVESLLYSFEFF
jgi:hypothetical protein